MITKSIEKDADIHWYNDSPKSIHTANPGDQLTFDTFTQAKRARKKMRVTTSSLIVHFCGINISNHIAHFLAMITARYHHKEKQTDTTMS